VAPSFSSMLTGGGGVQWPGLALKSCVLLLRTSKSDILWCSVR